jgi:hypothetical protein
LPSLKAWLPTKPTMKLINNEVWLCFDDLVNVGISENTLKSHKLRGASGWDFAADPADKRKVLVRWATLKPKYRDMVVAQYGEPLARIKGQGLAGLVAVDSKEGSEYTLIVPQKEMVRLRHLAAILKIYNSCGKDKAAVQALGLGAKNLKDLVTILRDYALKEGWCKWENDAILVRNAKKYAEEGFGGLVSKKYGNTNSQVVDATIWTQIGELYALPTKLNAVQIQQLLQTKHGVTLSVSAVKNYMNEPELRARYEGAREGYQVQRNTFDVVVKRYRPTQKGMLWVMDGSPFELLYKDEIYNKKKNETTVKIGTMTLMLMIDAYDDSTVGWLLCESETSQNVRDLVRQCYRNTGYLAAQIQSDNSSAVSGNGMVDWLRSAFGRFTPAEVHNARSKVIEQRFGKIWTQAKVLANSAGLGIGTRTQSSKMNQDWLAVLRKDDALLPDRMGLFEQVAGLLATPSVPQRGKQPQPTGEMVYEGVHRFDAMQKAEMLYEWRGKDGVAVQNPYKLAARETYTFTNKGLLMTIDGEQQTYEAGEYNGGLDMAFYTKHITNKFYVKYDPADLREVLLVDTNDKAVGLLHTARQMPMALADRKGNDSAVLGVRLAQKKEVQAEVKATIKDQQAKAKKHYIVEDAELRARGAFGLTDGVQKDGLNAAEEQIKSLTPTLSKGDGDGRTAQAEVVRIKPKGRKVNAIAAGPEVEEKPKYKGRIAIR